MNIGWTLDGWRELEDENFFKYNLKKKKNDFVERIVDTRCLLLYDRNYHMVLCFVSGCVCVPYTNYLDIYLPYLLEQNVDVGIRNDLLARSVHIIELILLLLPLAISSAATAAANTTAAAAAAATTTTTTTTTITTTMSHPSPISFPLSQQTQCC